MKIYNKNNCVEYYNFSKEISIKNIDINQFYSNLPIYIISNDSLNNILNENNISTNDKKQ